MIADGFKHKPMDRCRRDQQNNDTKTNAPATIAGANVNWKEVPRRSWNTRNFFAMPIPRHQFPKRADFPVIA
jgi:hypothetical protein